MRLHPADATELATIARKVGADAIEGNLHYRSGSWQLSVVDPGEYLDRYRDRLLIRASM